MLKRIQRRLRFELGFAPLKETTHLLGRTLTVFEGAIPRKPDKDTAWVCALARNSDVLLDVGANVGQTAIMALAAGIRRIAVVEAEPSALLLCVENVITNYPGAAFTPLLCFASDTNEGATELYTLRYGSANSMFKSHAESAAKRGKVVSVPNRTLDSLVEENELDPDFVKVDIEGAESLALRGATALARRGRAHFLIEMHGSEDLPMEENARRVLGWAESVGHAVYYLCEHRRLEDPAEVAHRGRCHFLIQPLSRPYPQFLEGISEGAPLDR